MGHIGKFSFVGLDYQPPGGGKSYLEQVAEGARRDTLSRRMRHLAELNFAHNYFRLVRFKNNMPDYLNRHAERERKIMQPFAGKQKTERAEHFLSEDFHIEEGLVPVDLVHAMHADVMGEKRYIDPYKRTEYLGEPEDLATPMLYMDFERLFLNKNFQRIVANQAIIDFCREALGPAAALSWAWSWISNPGHDDYQNQMWHRDSAEPLNMLKVFIPLNAVQSEEDGPTVIIPRTSQEPGYRELKRFYDMELSVLQAMNGFGMIPADEGDVYFINTMCLHRGMAPKRRRAILTLLVSLSPSHRTASIPRIAIGDLPEETRAVVKKNKRFFRYMVE